MNKFLGTFEINSDSVIVSDPCYEMGVWCQAKIDNVKTGEWLSLVKQSDEGSWGIRNAELIIFHTDKMSQENLEWSKEEANIGVDSGQAGIYDIDVYRNNDCIGDIQNEFCFDIEKDGEKFYALNCDLTLGTELHGGVINNGVVSSSGYGDGSYDLFTSKDDNGKIVAMKIVFIDEEKDSE
ncbi:DUF4241 domain-containing protein [Bacillus haynesii]|uniref:DUF4241 domain-containing protein n=1 Tax=Bacillus haynesii TaxID=1925021 RepID=UPI0022806FD3|nr:DUF4241 domain-containing protein [Bacillus haynesii]MCY8549383.1 DUF4241 domain-containing protein [Bacillus haynesii]